MRGRLVRSAALSAWVVLALAACVSQPAREVVPVAPAQAQANDTRRGAVVDWDLSGRIAVSDGAHGGSGRIDWQQRAGGYTISLGAPVTRQSWRAPNRSTFPRRARWARSASSSAKACAA